MNELFNKLRGFFNGGLQQFVYGRYYDWRYSGAAKQQILENAKIYVKNIPDSIRLFVTEGPGYGDQTSAITIIEYIKSLGYKGVVEVIGHAWKDKPPEIKSEAPLTKIM